MIILGIILIINGIGMISAGMITTDGSLKWLPYVGIGLLIIGIILIKKENEWLSSPTIDGSHTQLKNNFNIHEHEDDNTFYEEEEHYYLNDSGNTEIFPCGHNEWEDSSGNKFIDDGYGNLYEDD